MQELTLMLWVRLSYLSPLSPLSPHKNALRASPSYSLPSGKEVSRGLRASATYISAVPVEILVAIATDYPPIETTHPLSIQVFHGNSSPFHPLAQQRLPPQYTCASNHSLTGALRRPKPAPQPKMPRGRLTYHELTGTRQGAQLRARDS